MTYHSDFFQKCLLVLLVSFRNIKLEGGRKGERFACFCVWDAVRAGPVTVLACVALAPLCTGWMWPHIRGYSPVTHPWYLCAIVECLPSVHAEILTPKGNGISALQRRLQRTLWPFPPSEDLEVSLHLAEGPHLTVLAPWSQDFWPPELWEVTFCCL